ncbi:lipase/esterase [Alcanivorax hongdengensis A-11-3]|uniref:Lipase/esterase n=1 Tax=Alcanivorax hongdengensis A-11-3 TaxID=1177179 RepID=L0WGJ8_9GAMM|nr:alpha/beta hydrolase [Alcanivorax hongdengensis]EKF75844.1 lipase/esterase [Alcanivorax hongdengensis A-11-3]
MNSSAERISQSRSIMQQAVAGVLRRSLRLLFKPVANPRVSVALQRRWLNIMAQSTLRNRSVNSADRPLAGVPCRHYQPLNATGTVLYLHGGGYVAGSPDSHKAITSHLAHYANAHVVVPDYRLAPEHPCPAAIEDAVAVYRHLLASGVEPQQLTLAGDSAGGGLTFATLQALKAAGEPLPGSVIVFSPWVDLSLTQLFDTDRDIMLSEAWLGFAARAYGGDDLSAASRSPINGDLSGLPPVLIQVGGDEILLNDSQRLCQAIHDAGGQARLQVHPQRWHDFQLHAGVLTDADQALMTCARFIHQHREPS